MHWTEVSELPTAEKLGTPDPATFGIFGWSRGYFAFGSTGSPAIATAYSSDGLRWTAGRQLDRTGLGNLYIGDVAEGPAGLLAIGSLGAACGPTAIPALWRSSDGIAWTRVDMTTAFDGGAILTIDAGSSGYIATGRASSTGGTPAVWASTNAVTWKQVKLAAETFKGIAVQDATAFSGGYVLAGSVPALGADGCGDDSYETPSLWWSPDAVSWTRDAVPGTTDGTTASMSVRRISDHAVLATESSQTGDATTTSSWTSTDGRTWKPLSSTEYWPITNGQRGLVVNAPYRDAAGQLEPMAVYAFEDDLSVVKLTQTGDLPDQQPWADGSLVVTTTFGPTGLIVADSSGDIWVGVPVAG